MQKYRLKHQERIQEHQRKYTWENYHNGTSNTVSIDNINEKLYWRYGNGKHVHRVIAEKV